VARGDIITLANGASTLRPLADAARSIVLNNRNNGNVYVAADELPDTKFFDYIVGPNNAARLPGMFRETVGLLYQDLSGAGTAGQIEWFRSDRVVDAPEYGPIGSSTPTSFANVDLAQVATPSAPASGFSRLFASAVDQQLWYELPSGVLIPVSQQAKLQLDSTATTDLINGAIAANTWTDLTSALTFTVDDASSIVEITVRGCCTGVNSTNTHSIVARAQVDGSTNKQLGGAFCAANTQNNFLGGGGDVFLTGLAAASHTVKVQIQSTQAGTALCRAATNPTFEYLSVQVMEYKR
jgi:hypothetical protein